MAALAQHFCLANAGVSIIALAAMCSILSNRAIGDGGEGAVSVSAADLHSGRAKIIGYLGHPMGEVVTVRGTWYAPPKLAKISAPIYRITHINSKPVKQPLDFTHYRVRAVNREGRSGRSDKDGWDWKTHWNGKIAPPDFKPGEEWEFTGAETCYIDARVSAWNDGSSATAPDFGANGFLATFEFIRARRLDSKQGPAASAVKAPSQ